MNGISVVLPAYMEEENLKAILPKIRECLKKKTLKLSLWILGSLYFFNGILKDFRIGIEKRRLAIFLFCSSLWFVLPVFAVAQYDILGVFFILWGFREYL